VHVIEAALPEMRATRRKGLLVVVISVIATAVLVYLTLGWTDGESAWIIMALMPGLFGVLGAFGWVRGKHERLVMPVIAGVFGLTYQKSPPGFFVGLPKVFIPRGGRRSVDDMMTGHVADCQFRFAECKTETGGKNSSTLFKGVVLEVQSKGGVPAFLIASEKETKGFLFFKGRVDVDGMEMMHQTAGHDGKGYGLWARSSEAGRLVGLRAFMDQIVALGPRVLGDSALYSLVSDGRAYFISLSHRRDLFAIGGLLAGDDEVMRDIRKASDELAYPVRLATEVMRAEGALLAAR